MELQGMSVPIKPREFLVVDGDRIGVGRAKESELWM